MKRNSKHFSKSARRRSLKSLEVLEDRVLLAAASTQLVQIEQIEAMLDGRISGATIITHGFQMGPDSLDLTEADGDSLLPLAEAIWKRANTTTSTTDPDAFLVDYDIPDEGASGGIDLADSKLPAAGSKKTTKGELVVLFDWAFESNEASPGWTSAAGDALFNTLVRLGVVDPESQSANVPLHFIGHSFGAAVTSEAVERLAQFEIQVDQVTYLDPHDVDQSGIPIDGDQQQYLMGMPQVVPSSQSDSRFNYGATVWDNVDYADTYYQTTLIPGIPDGRPIPGAWNVELEPGGVNPHSTIWQQAYLGTISNPSSQTWGYRTSRLGTADPAVREAVRSQRKPVFFENQDHKLTSPGLVDSAGKPVVSTAEQFDITNAAYAPNWNSWTIENGGFSAPGDQIQRLAGSSSSNIVPGWSHHGGGGNAKVVAVGGGYQLELSSSGTLRTHNAMYVPEGAVGLSVDVSRVDASADDVLQISSNGLVLANIPLTTVSKTVETIFIPSQLRGTSTTLRVSLVKGGAAIDSVVRLDNFAWVAGGNTGDVFPIDVAAMFPGKTFSISGFRAVGATSETEIPFTVNPQRGDLSLKGGEAGYVLFADRVDTSAEPFHNSGRFYFAPGTGDGLTGDSLSSLRGFQGRIDVLVVVDGITRRVPLSIRSGASGDGVFAVGSSESVLDVARVQQRLRYLGFPGSNATALVVDGIKGPLTKWAISLANAGITGGNITADVELLPATANLINASNAPTWTSLGLPATAGDYSILQGAVVSGTSGAIGLFKAGVRAARAAGLSSSTSVVVTRISKLAGGPITGISSGFQAGLDIAVQIPAAIRTASTGSALSAAENQWVLLIRSLVGATSGGASLHSVRLGNSKIVTAVNTAVGRTVAILSSAGSSEMIISTVAPFPVKALTSVQKESLLTGLDQTAVKLEEIRTTGPAARPITGIVSSADLKSPVSTGDLFEVGSIVRSTLLDPLRDYLTSNPFAKADDLVNALKSFTGNSEGFSNKIVPSSVSRVSTGSATAFRLQLRGDGARSVKVNLGADQSKNKIVFSAGADLSLAARMIVELTFGVDSDGFFVQIHSLQMDLNGSATNLRASAQAGFVEASVSGGTLNLQASVRGAATSVQFLNSQELASKTIGQVVNLTATGKVTGELPVTAQVGTYTTPAGAKWTFDVPDLFSQAQLSLQPNASFVSNLNPFSLLTPQAVVGSLDQFASILTGFSNTPDFNRNVPLLSQSLGQTLDMGQLFTESLIDNLARVRMRASVAAPASHVRTRSPG